MANEKVEKNGGINYFFCACEVAGDDRRKQVRFLSPGMQKGWDLWLKKQIFTFTYRLIHEICVILQIKHEWCLMDRLIIKNKNTT